MRICWVVAAGFQFDPTVNVDVIKDIGSIWGSWTTWRGCGTDNVICSSDSKASELLSSEFHKGCTFYTPNKTWKEFNRPRGVQSYGGQFEHEIQNTDDIVALHLATSTADIVLMMGFNLTTLTADCDRHYYGHVLSVIKQHTKTQWVLVNHSSDLDKNFRDLPNLTCDTFENVLQLLAR